MTRLSLAGKVPRMSSAEKSSKDSGSLLSRRSALLWWGLSLLALVIGYADLWRGGITIGPIMLVLAYCVLVPLAILRG